MRILVIVHQFLPRNSTGTEVYAYKLAKALQARGHELCVYATFRDASRPQFEMDRSSYDGLPVYEVVHNHLWEDFRATYRSPRMEEHLETVLDEFRPDVVHVQHLHFHGIGTLERLKQRGIPILYTLAEYVLLCHRAWLVRLDFSLCSGPEPAECARCALQWPAPERSSWLARALALDPRRPKPRLSLRRFLDKQRRRLFPAADIRAMELRWQEHVEALAHVDRFIAPSRFLRDKFVEHGLVPADRIHYSDYGFDHEPFRESLPRSDRRSPLVVGFIGSVAQQKGVDVLVEACSTFRPDELVLHVHGDLDSFPEYGRRVRQLAQHEGVRFFGRYDNARIAEVLAEFDVIAVPSLWYENSPLTIHEAFLAKVPVLTGNDGGMAELVEHEVAGLQFRIGDVQDLRKQLRRLLDEEELLPRLRTGIPAVKDIAEDARQTEEQLEKLLAARVS